MASSVNGKDWYLELSCRPLEYSHFLFDCSFRRVEKISASVVKQWNGRRVGCDSNGMDDGWGVHTMKSKVELVSFFFSARRE